MIGEDKETETETETETGRRVMSGAGLCFATGFKMLAEKRQKAGVLPSRPSNGQVVR